MEILGMMGVMFLAFSVGSNGCILLKHYGWLNVPEDVFLLLGLGLVCMVFGYREMSR